MFVTKPALALETEGATTWFLSPHAPPRDLAGISMLRVRRHDTGSLREPQYGLRVYTCPKMGYSGRRTSGNSPLCSV